MLKSSTMKKFTLMLLVSFFVLNFAPLKAQVNDDIANAIVIPHSVTWVSGDAEYTTVGASADMNAASCWNTNLIIMFGLLSRLLQQI